MSNDDSPLKSFALEPENQEDEVPSSASNVEAALNTFRAKWQQELTTTDDGKKSTTSIDAHEDALEVEEQEARRLFLRGEELEKAGKVYEALQFYRRAVQLVPDIELRLNQNLLPKSNNVVEIYDSNENLTEEDHTSDGDDNDSDRDVERDDVDLLQKIQKKVGKLSTICIPKHEQRATHISALPMEMVLSILRWVVSSDLDLRSLEMFSMVCRGFYLCARDSEIWRLACLRVWGLNCGASPHNYPSWRRMYLDRTRLNFNGCYIGKITYIRHGENSFQDQFYRPWHLVTYYRYLRFFPEGVVLVLTSSDDPAQCVTQLKNKNARNPILRGLYRLKDDKITLVVQRQENSGNKGLGFKGKVKRRGGENQVKQAEQTYHMELEIRSVNKRRHVQLVWTHYSVFTRSHKGDESTCNFDLVGNSFPPFWFSRVKSYTLESDSPLQ